MTGLDHQFVASGCHTPFCLQAVGDFLRHVILVVLGQHGVGLEDAVSRECAFRDDALLLAKQVRQDAGIGHRHRFFLVGDREGHRSRRRRA